MVAATSEHGVPVAIVLPEPYEDLAFMTPLSPDRADRLVRFLATVEDAIVLDVGCGWDRVDAAEVQNRSRTRKVYSGGYRGVLEMAYLCLVAV